MTAIAAEPLPAFNRDRAQGAWPHALLAGPVLPLLVLLVSVCATIGAMRTTSTTFDEIVLIAAGARGFETGLFDMTPDHPPLMQYAYGLPTYLSRPRYPVEAGAWGQHNRYLYAQTFFWQTGNAPEQLAFRARLVGVAFAIALALLVYGFTRSTLGARAALFALTLAALLPDLLAHAGVAYNDVPHAAAFFGALWLTERALRTGALTYAAGAGCAIALALGIKYTAILLGPIALVLLGAQLWLDRRSPARLRVLLIAAVTTLAAWYVTTALVYGGDFALVALRDGVTAQMDRVRQGRAAHAYLLGDTSASGFWYFYPVAFLFKTPAALHVMIALVALLPIALRARAAHEPTAPRTTLERARNFLDGLCASRLRMPLVASLVVTAVLVASKSNLGFRYALPVLPFVCVFVAAGLDSLWQHSHRLRIAVVTLLLWYAGASLYAYPNFLSYTSEYTPEGEGYRALADSSLDWGQGLLALREDMQSRKTQRVYLSYFGSAIPEGYGIRYLPLPSFAALPAQKLDPGEAVPAEVVISATHLAGLYLPNDPYAQFRSIQPDRVLAGSLYVFRLRD